MASTTPRLYIWRKTASSKWADAWEERVCGAVGAARVAIACKGPAAKLLSITACNLTASEARLLVREFGGAADAQSETDWAALTSKPRAPLRIRDALIVSDQPPPERNAGPAWLQIGASAAFGTGDHATTAMCLRFLADNLPRGGRVLDAGCGSAILALAALRLGAASAVAIDNDPLAVRVARQNARANRLSARISIRLGEVSRETAGKLPFDLICANLFAAVLEGLFPLFRSLLAPGGLLVYSGVLRSQEGETARAARAAGLEIVETRRRGKWAAVLATSGGGQRRKSSLSSGQS